MKLISDLPDGYWEKDVDEFLDLLRQAIEMLDTFGQIQATVGGLVMAGKAGRTFETSSHLQRHMSSLLESRAREKAEKKRK